MHQDSNFLLLIVKDRFKLGEIDQHLNTFS